MRYEDIKISGCYLLENIGAGDRDIFVEKEDQARFLFLILYFVSPTPIFNTHWYINHFSIDNDFHLGRMKAAEIRETKYLNLLAFSISPSGFKILVENLEIGAASIYMQRACTSYAKYFNSKYKKRGHVFSGPFRIKTVNKDRLLDASAFVHKHGKGEFSSFSDYTKENRWGDFLNPDLILKKLPGKARYKDFVDKFDLDREDFLK